MLMTFLLLIPTVLCNSGTVYINTSTQLETELEKITAAESGVTIDLKLNSSVTAYTLNTTTDFLLLHNVAFTMGSDRPIEIICTGTSSPGTGIRSDRTGTGIAFVNSTVSLYNLTFTGCGGYLNTLPHYVTDVFNSTSYKLHYSPHYASALLFVECTVSMNHVIMQSSFGFAVIGYNLNFSDFKFIEIRNSSQPDFNDALLRRGSGLLIHFNDPIHSTMNQSVVLENVQFHNNLEMFKGRFCVSNQYYNSAPRRMVYNAAGLTVVYTQREYNATVTIDKGRFSYNMGEYAGAFMIINYSTAASSTTTINNTLFRNNGYNSSVHCHGEDLQFFWLGSNPSYLQHTNVGTPLKIFNTDFNGSTIHYHHLGAIYFGVFSPKLGIHFLLKNVRFFYNSNSNLKGDCMTVDLSSHFGDNTDVSVTMDTITAISNTQRDHPSVVFLFREVKKTTFTGKGSFMNNYGTVIYAVNTHIYLQGEMAFIHNTGEKGGAIRVEGNGLLHFEDNLIANFSLNGAHIAGGAIYVSSNLETKCAIQGKNLSTVTALFSDNVSKMAGNSIYATPLYECKVDNIYYFNNAIEMYEKNFSISSKPLNTLLDISTHPDTLYTVFRTKNDSVKTQPLMLYPGEILRMNVSAEDKIHRHVFTVLMVEVLKQDNTDKQTMWIKTSGGNTILEGRNNTHLSLTIYLKQPQSQTQVQTNATLILSVGNKMIREFDIHLQPCPLGFTLHNRTGSCECVQTLKKISVAGSQCMINDRTILLPNRGNKWIGVTDKNKTTVSMTCPLTYCNTDPYYKYIKSTDDNKIMLSHNGAYMVPYCLHNRDGVLCGQCKEGYCLHLGSNECRKCSDVWYKPVLVILGVAAIGIILILVLYLLKLTLTTGTINGMIFYAQVANAGLLEQMTLQHRGTPHGYIIVHKICQYVIQLINLNVEFHIGSFHDINQLWRTGLSLSFPLYLLVIVIIIIIISRYSTWLSNKTSHSSVQVLVTVVHLSFSKLLLALIAVFTPAEVHTLDYSYKVWYWDGSVKYMKYPHILLVVTTTVIVSTFLVMYMVPLVFGKYLIRWFVSASLYLRPVLEAIQAPYKENRHFYFVARLVLVIFIYLIYIAFRSISDSLVNITISALLALFLIGQALFRPFKSKLLNVLDSWLMFNITAVYVTLWNNNPRGKTMMLVSEIVVVLALITFLLILVFHIVVALGCHNRLKNRLKSRSISAEQYPLLTEKIEKEEEDVDSFYKSLNSHREPLIFSDS